MAWFFLQLSPDLTGLFASDVPLLLSTVLPWRFPYNQIWQCPCFPSKKSFIMLVAGEDDPGTLGVVGKPSWLDRIFPLLLQPLPQ